MLHIFMQDIFPRATTFLFPLRHLVAIIDVIRCLDSLEWSNHRPRMHDFYSFNAKVVHVQSISWTHKVSSIVNIWLIILSCYHHITQEIIIMNNEQFSYSTKLQWSLKALLESQERKNKGLISQGVRTRLILS